ncbi:MAG TPA: proton-conducting transporter membrane subunit [Saprospiraceae bacterium]|nr:proton-conducting transporter membrane subunit [Saprospiraceae bacterium]HMT71205.1 proton-conducting transporter membrane subunit [Saprospiraceae bacterium]
MERILELLIVWPFLAFFISLFLPKENEKLISGFTFGVVGIHFFTILGLLIYWITLGFPVLNLKEFSIYESADMDFFIDFYFDHVTAVYSLIGAMLTFLVTTYSRIYLHRESGYKRFFYTILFFYAGYTLAVFAGNLETLFIGWEILGLTSFLLVAFYRERYLPVKNAFKVFSIYRIGDVGIILAMWASHHLWHENITFAKIQNYELVHHHLEAHSVFGLFISIMLLTAACAKSAQFPFSSWLPRAMEGPTPSSAIFYGSLSVHLGLFLLIRTMPFWEHQLIARIMIGAVGIFTAAIGASIGRVQSSVKSQIAYASVAQIGLMFLEVALGFKNFALFHFAGNAFLRTYQLLVSPSAVSYLIREQFYHFVPKHEHIETHFSKKMEYTLFLLSIKEYNMDDLLDKLLWKPFKKLGNLLRFINIKNVYYITIPTFIAGVLIQLTRYSLPPFLVEKLPEIFALIGLMLVFRAYSGRWNVFVVWTLLLMNHFWVVLAISFNEHLTFYEIFFHLAGVIPSGILGYFVLWKMTKLEPGVDLNKFQGHVFEHPRLAALFLLACLGMAGFPITSTFVGEDILFSHIAYDQVFLAFYLALGFVISGIALIRMYARIFLGPHVKRYHAIAQRSS